MMTSSIPLLFTSEVAVVISATRGIGLAITIPDLPRAKVAIDYASTAAKLIADPGQEKTLAVQTDAGNVAALEKMVEHVV